MTRGKGHKLGSADVIGERYGKQGQLEVLSIEPPANNTRYCLVKCHECAKDPELFGEAIFRSRYGNLTRGSEPCGCSPSYQHWTEAQDRVKIERLLDTTNYSFEGYSGEYKGKASKIILKCKRDGHTETFARASVSSRGVPKCRECIASERTHNPTDKQRLEDSGLFVQGAVFNPVGKSQDRVYQYSCPSCREDKYTKAGLCTGVFQGPFPELISGRKPCRCSCSYRWPADQRAKQVNDVLSVDPHNKSSLIGWGEPFINSTQTEAIFECSEHGRWVGYASQVLFGRRCPVCSGAHQQDGGYLYVLQAQSETSAFTGFGVTNHPEQRFRCHKSNLKGAGFTIKHSELFEFPDEADHRGAEAAIKREFPLHSQDIEGFRLEATFPDLYKDVLEFVRQYQADLCC